MTKKTSKKSPPKQKSPVEFNPEIEQEQGEQSIGRSPGAQTLEPNSSVASLVTNESKEISEAILTITQRRKRAMQMRRMQSRLKRFRAMRAHQFANPARLKMRANRMARRYVRGKFAGTRGKKYSTLNPSARITIDKLISNKGTYQRNIARRMMPIVRRADRMKKHRVSMSGSRKKAGGLGYMPSPRLDRAEYIETRDDYIIEQIVFSILDNDNSRVNLLFKENLIDREELDLINEEINNNQDRNGVLKHLSTLLSALHNDKELYDKFMSIMSHDIKIKKKKFMTTESLEENKHIPKHLDTEKHPSIAASKKVSFKLKSKAPKERSGEAKKDTGTRLAKKDKSPSVAKPRPGNNISQSRDRSKENKEKNAAHMAQAKGAYGDYKRRPTSAVSYHGPVTINNSNTYHGNVREETEADDSNLYKLINLYKKIRGKDKTDRVASPIRDLKHPEHVLKHRRAQHLKKVFWKEEAGTDKSPGGVPIIKTKAIITFKKPDKTIGKRKIERNIVPETAYRKNPTKDSYGQNRYASPKPNPYKVNENIVDRVLVNLKAAKQTIKDVSTPLATQSIANAAIHMQRGDNVRKAAVKGVSNALADMAPEIANKFKNNKKAIDSSLKKKTIFNLKTKTE